MLHNGRQRSQGNNDKLAREDFANHLLGFTTLAIILARGDTRIDFLTAAYLKPFTVALDGIPTFKEYLSSGTGVELAPRVSSQTIERMQQISLNLRDALKALNEEPSNRESLASLLELVSATLPAQNMGQSALRAGVKQVRAGHGLTWSDVLAAIPKK